MYVVVCIRMWRVRGPLGTTACIVEGFMLGWWVVGLLGDYCVYLSGGGGTSGGLLRVLVWRWWDFWGTTACTCLEVVGLLGDYCVYLSGGGGTSGGLLCVLVWVWWNFWGTTACTYLGVGGLWGTSARTYLSGCGGTLGDYFMYLWRVLSGVGGFKYIVNLPS